MTVCFEDIQVNMETGELVYPCPKGFELDEAKLARVATLFVDHCGSVEQAIRHAVHGQLAAYEGQRFLTAGLRN